MLLNDAGKLGVLRGWIIGIMESPRKELQWSTFQVWVGQNRSNILRARCQEAESSQEEERLGSGDASPLTSDDGDE